MNDLVIRAIVVKAMLCDAIREKRDAFLKEERGGAEILAVIILVAIVVLLAVFFREQLGELVSEIWNSISGKTEKISADFGTTKAK